MKLPTGCFFFHNEKSPAQLAGQPNRSNELKITIQVLPNGFYRADLLNSNQTLKLKNKKLGEKQLLTRLCKLIKVWLKSVMPHASVLSRR